ncbi:MAG: pullulanase-type alpha-1,6-glucosidase [Xanthomonadales bacterium]|nr:pullulanase-type alpha-1,6-glucosidase [Xanthomonadales bacterium]
MRCWLIAGLIAPGWGTGAEGPGDLDLSTARAHWISANTLLWAAADDPGLQLRLHADPEGGLNLGGRGISGGEAIVLTASDEPLSADQCDRWPHLAHLPVLRIDDAEADLVRRMLRGQVAVSATDGAGTLVAATGIQVAGVLDDLFAYAGSLGLSFAPDRSPTLRLWAPTARAVSLLLFDDAEATEPVSRTPMRRNDASGVWEARGEPAWYGKYYLYEVRVFAPSVGKLVENRVTDPYSVSLAADSARSQIVDLADPALMPDGWSGLVKPPFSAPEEAIIYELHVRDFSISDATVPAEQRGTFAAFTASDSGGIRHLSRLASAGVSHLHLLPVFDIATVPERRSDQQHPDPNAMAQWPPDSTQQQAAILAVQDRDGFNWGYDPWHYTVPEGSYATDPTGTQRIREFRAMVAVLNRLGLRVVMDVVYNHTHAAGQDPRSVLDRIVPGYYQRLDEAGRVATSTCCPNTATEHAMMEKLMIDSVLTWATAYKVDGFRFDLMGHHSKANMLRLRAALDRLTLAEHGVDGKAIYLYGEGWNFGEVANDARFVQASQLNLGGTGIGSFSDRLRDGARGGVHGSDPRDRGFTNGLEDEQRLLAISDWIRVGLAGDVADYRFENATGQIVAAAQIDYNGSPAGYTEDPSETISYVAAHDNETLFDAHQMKLPQATSLVDRVWVQTLSSALVLLGQGIPFIHAGQEFLRSKSLDRDSFNSGDWFNAIDWTLSTGNWGKGLPVANRNREHWPLMAPLLADAAIAPGPEHRRMALDQFEALLRIRRSTPLLRLRTGEQIRESVSFHNTGPDQVPGLIVMSVRDHSGTIDPDHAAVLVLFNGRADPVTFSVPAFDEIELRPHPELAVLHQSAVAGSVTNGVFPVPARGVAVFLVAR